MKLLLNIVGFNVTWLACVIGGAQGLAWLGPLVLLGFFLTHRLVLGAPRNEWQLAASVAAIGLAVDSSYVFSGLLEFATPWPTTQAAPIWIVAMWANYALTLNHSLRWFQNHLVLGAVFGAVGGPAAYLAGRALGGVEFLAPDATVLAVLALAWGAAVPLTLKLASRFSVSAGPQAAQNPHEVSRA